MRHASMALVASLVLMLSNAAFGATWNILTNESLVNRSAGPDGRWLTADDRDLGAGPGANTHGSAFNWQTQNIFGLEESYFTGSYLISDLSAAPVTALLVSQSIVFEILGVDGVFPADPLSTTTPSTIQVAADQSVTVEQNILTPAAYKVVSSGLMLFPGDAPATLTADATLAAHLDFLLGLLPAGWTAAMFQEGDFFTLDGTSFSTPFSGFIYTSAVPLPPSALLLAVALVPLARRAGRTTRRQNG